MKRLILMRHAKTEAWVHGVDDFARALLPTGHDAAFRMAAMLSEKPWTPDHILVSSARRTRETCKYMTDVFHAAKVTVWEDLYLAGERGIRELISSKDDAETLMVIGHNPGLHDLALTLTREHGTKDHQAAITLSAKMPTGAAAIFDADEDGSFDRSRFALSAFIRPKDLAKA